MTGVLEEYLKLAVLRGQPEDQWTHTVGGEHPGRNWNILRLEQQAVGPVPLCYRGSVYHET